jgi:hypothetical protein
MPDPPTLIVPELVMPPANVVTVAAPDIVVPPTLMPTGAVVIVPALLIPPVKDGPVTWTAVAVVLIVDWLPIAMP